MKKLLLALMLTLTISAQAEFRQKMNIKYKKEYGWSKYYYVDVNVMTGFELNQATRTYDYNSYSTYAVVFWGQGKATVMKITSYIACGYEATPSCISYYSSLKGLDQDGDEWYLCLTDYCY
jgi:hypothetical protein